MRICRVHIQVIVAVLQSLMILREAFADECGANKIAVNNVSLTTTADLINSKPYQNSTCIWSITAPPGHIATITITKLTFSAGNVCGDENFKIFDGASSADKLVKMYCTKITGFGKVIWLTGVNGRLELKQGASTTGPTLQFYVKAEVKPKACKNGTIKLQASSQTTNLTSPSYPSTYPMSCHWLIEAPQGKQVKLTFTSIQIYFCEEETLHVYDGETPQVVLKKCRIDRGSNEVTYLERNKPIFSYGRELLVVFKTDEYFVSDFKGFTASYTSVEGGKECGPGKPNTDNIPLSSSTGTITSPGFPVSLPLDAFTCVWRLKAPKGQVIKVDLDSIALHGAKICNLVFYTDSESEVFRFHFYTCGNHPFGSIVSSGRLMKIRFQKDHGQYFTGPKGFDLQYSTIPSISKNGTCKTNGEGTINVQGDAGTILSPNYPSQHPTNMTCRWKIAVTPGNVIELAVSDTSHFDCITQLVRIYDGPNTSSPELVKLCKTYSGIFFSSTNHILVEFVTKGNAKSEGFYITYVARKAKRKPYAAKCSTSIEEINAASGQIASQRFPLNYSNNAYCRVKIKLPKLEYLVNLNFTSFETEPDGDKCDKDYVEVRSLGYKLGKFCGKKNTPFSVMSKNNEMEIDFRTDASGRYPGYEATFTSVQDSRYRSCTVQGKDNIIPMTTPSGTIFSPRYPDGYPTNMRCTWKLQPPKDKFIRVSFDALRMKNCRYASLEVRDIQTNKLIARLCQDAHLRPFIFFSSAGSGLVVQFNSSKAYTWGGFTASYETTSQLPQSISCGGSSLNGKLKESSSGSIASYEYPLKYQNNVKCTWVISTTSSSYRFNIKFDFMDIEPSPGCKDDYVQIRDGGYSFSESLGKFCGSTKPNSFKSSESSIFVEFKTNGTGRYGGFKLSYEETLTVLYIVLIVAFSVVGFCALIGIIVKCFMNNSGSNNAAPEGTASTAGSTIELTAKR